MCLIYVNVVCWIVRNDEDIVLWKIAADGLSHTALFTETTDNGTRDFGNHAQQTSDGGYIIIGDFGIHNKFFCYEYNNIKIIGSGLSGKGNEEILIFNYDKLYRYML